MKILDVFKDINDFNNDIKRPYIIAEAGVNHEGSMDLAKRLIDEAKEGGADAIKFQSYKADTIASKNSPAYWDLSKEPIDSQYKLFKKHDSFWKNEFETLRLYCDKTNIDFLSTPFDLESATFLNDLVNVFKISSSDITNKPFIEFICGFNKPIILSTGASYLYEIQEAVEWIEKYGNKLALLHCILNYPTKDDNANIGMILDLKRKFPDKIIGYSDHTLPGDMKVCELAWLLGSLIIEKHFTFDKSLLGNDHYHAMDKEDLKYFISTLNRDIEVIGHCKKYSLTNEEISRINARRSLVLAKSVKKNHTLNFDDFTFKRPGNGISPKEISKVVGKKAVKEIAKDTILKWDMII